MSTPQNDGREWESTLAARLGGAPVPGSGNGSWRKLDVEGKGLLVSAKHTDHDSFRVTRGDFREAVSAVSGPGGVGHDTVPVLGVRVGGISGEEMVVLRLSDFVGLMRGEIDLVRTLSAGEGRRERSKTPSLFRDND